MTMGPLGAVATDVVARSMCPEVFLVAGLALLVGDIVEGTVSASVITMVIREMVIFAIFDLILEIFYNFQKLFHIIFHS